MNINGFRNILQGLILHAGYGLEIWCAGNRKDLLIEAKEKKKEEINKNSRKFGWFKLGPTDSSKHKDSFYYLKMSIGYTNWSTLKCEIAAVAFIRPNILQPKNGQRERITCRPKNKRKMRKLKFVLPLISQFTVANWWDDVASILLCEYFPKKKIDRSVVFFPDEFV